jgi:hypothetical protein
LPAMVSSWLKNSLRKLRTPAQDTRRCGCEKGRGSERQSCVKFQPRSGMVSPCSQMPFTCSSQAITLIIFSDYFNNHLSDYYYISFLLLIQGVKYAAMIRNNFR